MTIDVSTVRHYIVEGPAPGVAAMVVRHYIVEGPDPDYVPPPPGPGVHRYWRLEFDDTNGGGVIAGSEIEFFESSGGPDVCVGGTPTQSSTYAPFGAANAVDDNTGTLFALNDTNGWWKYDFGSGVEKDIMGFSFKARTDGAENQSFRRGRLQWSDDDATWTTLFHVTGSSYTLGQRKEFYIPDEGDQRYWRVQGYCQRYPSVHDRLGCAELEFRDTAGGADQTGAGTALSDSDYGGNVAANAYDNTDATEWWSNVTNRGYIGYDFGAGNDLTINEIQWTSPTGLPATFSIDVGSVDGSPDGVCWRPRWLIDNGGTAYANNEDRVFTYVGGGGPPDPDPSGRRRQMIVT